MAMNSDDGIDSSHPRYSSLVLRKKLADGFKAGLVVPEGLIAHGRGEMFDYILGEKSIEASIVSERAAAAALLSARSPVISVNGNVAALCPDAVVALAEIVEARIEVNLFHWSNERAALIRKRLEREGAKDPLAENPDRYLKGLKRDRGRCHKDGIYSADVVLIALEDGDRASALAEMEKTVISIDLNPISRTTACSTIPIVDELTRAFPNISKSATELKNDSSVSDILKSYDREKVLRETIDHMADRLNSFDL